MAIKLNIPGVVPPRLADRSQAGKYVRPWISDINPPEDWYLRFSSAQYIVEPLFRRPSAGERATKIYAFRLTPVVNRPVYTFDDWGDFIEATRNFTIDLFHKPFTRGVDQYRIRRGPPGVHIIYPLAPHWTWSDP